MMMTPVPELARSILATSPKKTNPVDESPLATANTSVVDQKKNNMSVERPSLTPLNKRKLNEESDDDESEAESSSSPTSPEELVEERVISPKKKARANSYTLDVLKREGVSTPGALELEANKATTTTMTFVPIPFDGTPATRLKEEEVKILNFFLA